MYLIEVSIDERRDFISERITSSVCCLFSRTVILSVWFASVKLAKPNVHIACQRKRYIAQYSLTCQMTHLSSGLR